MDETRYTELSHFLGIYFGQDYDLWGQNAEELIRAYICESDATMWKSMLLEIEAFRKNHVADLDAAFQREFDCAIDLTVWGFTIESFLEEVQRHLKEAI
ncbi:contact-dependent growth inhibition system immunity protein [Cupriavidus sp. 2KB_3]|uniref:contact-dependent growth inhibition system immunity protein n=1 Tax=Cupriavidus TaxID=106589 RepID=UPI0011EC6F49|nr:contact-dependent growth inhibition system immunity protein [Cupriavidus campinensis]